MLQFEYENCSPRILFGAGRVRNIGNEIKRQRAQRVFVLCTRGRRAQAEGVLQDVRPLVAAWFDEAQMHVPMDLVTRAVQAAREADADLLVAIGGGSTVGLAKAVALETSLPILAVATTYAGSEVTSVYGVTDAGLKRTGRDPRALPSVVIYDVEMTLALPVKVSVTSAINAIAHAAEGLYASDANPITQLAAQEGARSIARALPTVVADPSNLEARESLLFGAWLCGHVLNNSSMGLHHKLCHTLGGTFNLPHADTHTVMLPHAIAYNAAYAPEAMAKLSSALESDTPALALFELAQCCGAPTSLKELGMPKEGLGLACELAVTNRYPNPAPLETSAMGALLARAFAGLPPRS